MDALSPESRALYDLLKADTREEYESRFLQYKKESLDAVKLFVDETRAQFKEMNASVEEVRAAISVDLVAASESIGTELAAVKSSLGSQIVSLAATVDRVLRVDLPDLAGGSASAHSKRPVADTAGLDGHRVDLYHRGTNCAPHMVSPVGGNTSDRPFVFSSSSTQIPF
jgi:hypothetical protein